MKRSSVPFVLLLLFTVAVTLGCNTASAVVQTLVAPTPTLQPTAQATFTPIAVQLAEAAPALDSLALQEQSAPAEPLIDAAGLDFADRRITDVCKRVAPTVVNITTQVLRRDFCFDIVP